MSIRILTLIAVISLLGGCATTSNLSAVPKTADEFNQPLDTIRAEYSDVALYEKQWRGFNATFGDVKALENNWGPATKVEKQWGQKIFSSLLWLGLAATGNIPIGAAITFEAFHFYPQEVHHWEKNNTRVEATVSKNAFSGYDPQLLHWTWTQETQSENTVANNIADKQAITVANQNP